VPAGAALYGMILAACKTLAAGYRPGYVNAVIVPLARFWGTRDLSCHGSSSSCQRGWMS
jgi:hypothetical protein